MTICPFFNSAALPNVIGGRSTASIASTARSLRGSAAFDRRLVGLVVGRGDIVVAFVAQDVIRGQDHPPADDNAGAVFVRDEIGIGRLRLRQRRRAMPERIGVEFQLERFAGPFFRTRAMATTDFSFFAMTSTSVLSIAVAASRPEGGSWARSGKMQRSPTESGM